MRVFWRALLVSLCAGQLAAVGEPQTRAGAEVDRTETLDHFVELLYRYGNSPHSGGIEMRIPCWEDPADWLRWWVGMGGLLSDDEDVSYLGASAQLRTRVDWRPFEPYAALGFAASYGGYGDFGSSRRSPGDVMDTNVGVGRWLARHMPVRRGACERYGSVEPLTQGALARSIASGSVYCVG